MDAFIEGALEECKKDGDPERGAVLALCAIAEAIHGLSDTLANASADFATEKYPLKIWVENQ